MPATFSTKPVAHSCVGDIFQSPMAIHGNCSDASKLPMRRSRGTLSPLMPIPECPYMMHTTSENPRICNNT
eukprot:8482988-Pyramimonas_sp.AAC.1